MKSLLLFAIFCITATTVSAQFSDKFLNSKSSNNSLYVTGDVMVGNYKGGDLGLNFMIDKKYSIKVGFSATDKSPIAPPSDFLKSAQTDVKSSDAAFQNFENFYLTFGRVLFLNSKQKARIVLQGGPGISNMRTPDNWRWSVNDGSQAVYVNDISVSKKICLIVNPKLELPIAPVMGISVGPMYMYSKENSFFGAGIGIIYGLI